MTRSETEPQGHPTVLDYAVERAKRRGNRVADAITKFAGSMTFVYIHIAWFALWIILRVEDYPYGLLTMIVSLEAIFLSTFVMITQNRQDELRSRLAKQEWRMVQAEEKQNEELITLSRQILELTKTIHELTQGHVGQSK